MHNVFKHTKGIQYHKKFWKDGYLLLPKFFSIKEAEKIKNIADNLEKYPEEKGKWMIYYEKDTHQNKKKARIENIINYNSELKDLVENKVQPCLESVYQKKMNLFKDKMNWKKPFCKGFHAHQDQPAWSDFPPSRFVTVAFFGNRTTKQNGCLEFVSGKHNEGLFDYDMGNLGELTPEVEKKMEWENIETSCQDLLIFDSFAPHKSKSNKTDKSRRIFYFTYHDAEEGDYYEAYIKKKREEFPPDIEREEGKTYKVKGSRYNLANPIE